MTLLRLLCVVLAPEPTSTIHSRMAQAEAAPTLHMRWALLEGQGVSGLICAHLLAVCLNLQTLQPHPVKQLRQTCLVGPECLGPSTRCFPSRHYLCKATASIQACTQVWSFTCPVLLDCCASSSPKQSTSLSQHQLTAALNAAQNVTYKKQHRHRTETYSTSAHNRLVLLPHHWPVLLNSKHHQ